MGTSQHEPELAHARGTGRFAQKLAHEYMQEKRNGGVDLEPFQAEIDEFLIEQGSKLVSEKLHNITSRETWPIGLLKEAKTRLETDPEEK